MLYNFIVDRLTNLGIGTTNIIFNGWTYTLPIKQWIAYIISYTALTVSLIILASCILLLFKFIHSAVHKWGDK